MLVRNAMFRRVQLMDLDKPDELGALDKNVLKNMNMIWPPLEVDADEMRRQLETL